MNLLDILIIIPLLWFGYKGFTKGFIIEAATLIALMAGIYAGFHFSWFIAGYLNKWFNIQSDYVPLISFSIVFILIVVLIFLLARALDKVVKKAALGLVNRIAGAALSAFKVLLTIGIIIVMMNRYDHNNNFLKPAVREGSLLYTPIEKLTMAIYPSVQEKLDMLFRGQGQDQIEGQDQDQGKGQDQGQGTGQE
jgi:membrane protein required for colicin V production